jgi:hypothetical protein
VKYDAKLDEIGKIGQVVYAGQLVTAPGSKNVVVQLRAGANWGTVAEELIHILQLDKLGKIGQESTVPRQAKQALDIEARKYLLQIGFAPNPLYKGSEKVFGFDIQGYIDGSEHWGFL